MSQRQCRIHVKVAKDRQIQLSDDQGLPADPEYSDRSEGDTFQWMSDSGSIQIDFPNGHPFNQNPPYAAPKGHWTPKVQVAPNAQPQAYKYNVTVVHDEHTYVQDPQVIIDDGRNLCMRQMSSAAEALFSTFITRVQEQMQTDHSRAFFRNGVEQISLEIRSGDTGVSISVSGTKSTTERER